MTSLVSGINLSTFQVIFGLLAALGGLAGAASLVSSVSQRVKINAEAKRIGVDADMVMSDKALEMYALARSEAQEAKSEAAGARMDSRNCWLLVDALRDHVDRLSRMMRDNGMKPPRFRAPDLVVDEDDES
ncbi:MAG TPA: hypothetical protein VIL10_09355 [Marmoricola sp.]